jgi:hypothetical protein
MTNGKVLVVRDTQGASHSQTDLTDGRIHGEIVQAPIAEAPGQTRVGRKDQHGSLLSFIGDAYLNEMGITNRPRPTDVTTVRTKDLENQPDGLDLADIDHFAHAVRSSGLQGICEPHLNRQKSAAEVSSRHSIATGNKSDAGQLSTLSVTKPETTWQTRCKI